MRILRELDICPKCWDTRWAVNKNKVDIALITNDSTAADDNEQASVERSASRIIDAAH